MNTNQYDLFNQSTNQATPATSASKAPSKTPKRILTTSFHSEVWKMLSPSFKTAYPFIWMPFIHNKRAMTNPELKEILDMTSVIITIEAPPEVMSTIQTEAFKALYEAVYARKGKKIKIICELHKHGSVIFDSKFNNLKSIEFIMDSCQRTIKNALKNCQKGGV